MSVKSGRHPPLTLALFLSVDIIKSGGYKLSALMIESVILEHPGVAEVAVVGMPDEVHGEVVTALVARKPSHAGLDQRELTGFCRERLAAYQVCACLFTCEE